MLSAPTFPIWLLSTVLIVLAVAAKYFGVATLIPEVGPYVSQHLFETLLAGYVLLWIGTVFKGI